MATKKVMQIQPILFEGMACQTCLTPSSELKEIVTPTGKKTICPTCWAKIVPPTTTTKKKAGPDDSRFIQNTFTL